MARSQLLTVEGRGRQGGTRAAMRARGTRTAAAESGRRDTIWARQRGSGKLSPTRRLDLRRIGLPRRMKLISFPAGWDYNIRIIRVSEGWRRWGRLILALVLFWGEGNGGW